jgi:2-oxoglutarate dehydrogenase E2 component (dihydrolipoamide succinyltransferase)
VRRRIAENLLWVTNNTARASTTVEVDFETVAATRATHAEGFRSQQGFSLTFLPFVAFTVLRALEKYPDIAAKVDLSANRWIVPQAVHLGIAVSREAGLTVPVIHDAQRLTFTELAIAIERAATAVRSGTLKPSDTQGGTLTITNPGSFGSYVSQPIVNRGESSILCVDGIEKRAVFVNGEIVARLRGFLTLAFDHCVVDGRAALTFLNHVKSQLQSLDDTWLQR